MTPAWVGPTMAIALVIIALSFLAIGGGAVFMVLFLHKQIQKLKLELSKFRDEALITTRRVKGEVDGFVELSTEARAKVRGAIETVETRLQDLDALVEVLQEEAEETALDVAAFVRTTRRAGGVLGAARRMMQRRRSAAD
jgi:uncharacterized protein YoxC